MSVIVNHCFYVGRRVTIKSNSPFSGQTKLIGIITKLDEFDDTHGEYWYNVEFPDGYKNDYHLSDLNILPEEWDI